MLSKISNKNKQYLKDILYHAERAKDLIMSKDVLICKKSSGTTTIEYQNKSGEFITPITKEYGSHLTGLFDVIEKLNYIIENT